MRAKQGDNSAADGAASPSPSAPPAPGSSAGNSPSSGTTPATPSMIMTQQQLADLGIIMATAMKDAFSSDGTAGNSALGRATSPGSGSGDITGTASGSVVYQQAVQKEASDLRYLESQVRKLSALELIPALNQSGWIWLEVLGGSFPASLARHPRSLRHPSERAKLNNVLDLRDRPENITLGRPVVRANSSATTATG